MPVKDQLYYRQAIAFKCMTGQAPEYLTSQFITREQVSERTTRTQNSELHPDREPFVTGLLYFGTIWNLFLS